MSSPTANCPSCGAPVTFRWSSAVQTVCPFCHSILVRTDLTLQNVGKVADLPARFIDRPRLGPIIYEYEQGGWNEWHIVFSDGTSGWLSDAQLQYAVSFLVQGIPLPTENQAYRGQHFNFSNIDFEVSTTTKAAYKGVEGELPFPFYGKSNMLFADLRTRSNDFATLDYSDPLAPVLFIGKTVPFEALQLQNVRQFEGWS